MFKNRSLSIFTAATIAAGVGLSANAATIVYNFNGATATGDGATAPVTSNDFGSGVAASVFTMVSGDGSGGFVDGFHDERLEITLDGSNVARFSTFSVDIPVGVVVDLTELSFDDGIQWGASRSNSTFSVWDIAIDNGGTATPSQVTNSRAPGGPGTTGPVANSLALSGLTGLTDTTVLFTINHEFGINADGSGGNDQTRQAFLDNLVLTGRIVPEQVDDTPITPEPAAATLALLGLGGLIARRRR